MWVIKARSKPPKPSRNFTQNKFGSHPNAPSTPSSQKTSTSHTKKGSLRIWFVTPDHYKKSHVTFSAIFWKRFSSGGGRVAKGCHRCYILARPWRGRTRTYARTSHLALVYNNLTLTYYLPEQSRLWTLLVGVALSWFLFLTTP